jgi:hypothetical protein
METIELYRRKGAPLSVMGGEVFEYERATKAEAVIEAAREIAREWAKDRVASVAVCQALVDTVSALDKE